VPGSW